MTKLVIGAILIGCISYALCMSPLAILPFVFRAHSARIRLLCKTDHHALLQAGRDVLAQVDNGTLEEGGYRLRGDPRMPKGMKFPTAILDLQPRAVILRDGHLRMEMHGGMDHFGFELYPADFNEPYQGYIYGHRKIIDGLWYYDDGYGIYPDYDEIIDALIQKHRREK